MRTLFTLLILVSPFAWSNEPEQAFIGAWKLLSIDAKAPDGSWHPSSQGAGSDAIGMIMYDDSGFMSVQIVSKNNPYRHGDKTDTKAEHSVYRAYFGTFSVDPATLTVYHDRQAYMVPSKAPTRISRRYQFVDNTLILQVPGRDLRLVWEKL